MPCQGDRWSCCGSDAFYRDEFLEEEATVGKAGGSWGHAAGRPASVAKSGSKPY